MKPDRTAEDKVDEDIHPPGPQALWGESWYFDAVAPDASAGAFLRAGTYPHLGTSWWWACVIADRETGPVVGWAVHERPLTEHRGLPLGIDDPELALAIHPDPDGWRLTAQSPGSGAAGGAPFSLDLGWRPVGPPYAYGRGQRYEQPGWVRGTVSVHGVACAIQGPGQRDHSWGVRDWWRFGWDWCAGWLADDERFQATLLAARGRIAPDGYRQTATGERTPVGHVALTGTATRRQLTSTP